MRYKLAGAATAAAALCLAVPAFGATPSSAPTVTTLHLVEVDNSFAIVNDTPPRLTGQNSPFSVGDSFVFTSELKTKAGKHAGWLHAYCVTVRGGNKGVSQCTGTFRLAGGMMELQTVTGNGGGPSRIAIVGGTGAYAGIRGEVRSVSSGQSTSNDVVTFWK